MKLTIFLLTYENIYSSFKTNSFSVYTLFEDFFELD